MQPNRVPNQRPRANRESCNKNKDVADDAIIRQWRGLARLVGRKFCI